MKLSEVTNKDIADYLVVDEIDELTRLKRSAIAYIKSYTGLSLEELDNYEELTEAMLCLCSEFYDNRAYGTKLNYENKVITSILDRHRRGLIR